MLVPVLNFGIRLSIEAFKTSRTESLYVEVSMIPLRCRRKFHMIKDCLKCMQHLKNTMLAEITNIDGRLFQNTPFLQPFGIVAKNLCECYIPDGAMVMLFPAPAPSPGDISSRSICKELTMKRRDGVPNLTTKTQIIMRNRNVK